MGTSFLGRNEYLLRNQKVKGTQKIDKQALMELYRQKSNRKIIVFPVYIYLHEFGQRNFNKDRILADRQETIEKFDAKIAAAEKDRRIEKFSEKKRKQLEKIDRKLDEGNIFMRWGEPVSTLDSQAVEATTEQMTLYMKTKGFLDASADYQVKVKGRTARVIFRVEEGTPYLIDTVVLKTTDTNIQNIVASHVKESLLRRRDRYNQENFELERERIETLLRDHGYYNFSRQYINFLVDTTDQTASIETIINNPKSGNHKVFRVDSVIFHIDEPGYSPEDKHTVRFRGIGYAYSNRRFSEKILGQRIFISPDSLYSYNATLETQRQLANLDNFKFINIYYDSAGGSFIANIHASPLKKFQTNNELGLGIIVSEGYPSPFYNFSLKNRNVFTGLENMELSARIGIEGIPSATDADLIYNSIEAGGNFSLTLPQFALPLGSRLKRRLGNINPKTQVIAGATFSNRPEYRRNIFNTTMTYYWQKENKQLYNFSLIDLNLINTVFNADTISRAFENKLKELELAGNKLINSFKPSFVNSTAFSATFNPNQYGLFNRESSIFKFYIENGGTFLNLTGTEFLGHLEHYKFFKSFAEFRHYRPMPNATGLALRTFIGFASPYAGTEALPYEKYYFAGGSNGIRAWRPRRLGPGSYSHVKVINDGPPQYDDSEQPADILFEANLELRRKIIGFFDGALFVDAGNSWILEPEESRPGADFRMNRFYKEIAVGAGAGFRFDFSFLLIRVDLAFKAYDPARPEGSRFVLDNSFNDAPFDKIRNYTLNLGIGYPF